VSTWNLCLKEEGHDRRQYIMGNRGNVSAPDARRSDIVHTSPQAIILQHMSYPIRLEHCSGGGLPHNLAHVDTARKKKTGSATSKVTSSENPGIFGCNPKRS
jgi:hypothetical protein